MAARTGPGPIGKTIPSSTPAVLPPLQGEPYSSAGVHGVIYNAQEYVRQRMQIPAAEDTLKLYHHTPTPWAPPGENAKVSTTKSHGNLGVGFYTDNKPAPRFGPHEFELGIPIAQLAQKKVLEVQGWIGPDFHMPPEVDVLVYRCRDVPPFVVFIPCDPPGPEYYIVFKPGSEGWLNACATRSAFDQVGDPVGWNGDAYLPPKGRGA